MNENALCLDLLKKEVKNISTNDLEMMIQIYKQELNDRLEKIRDKEIRDFCLAFNKLNQDFPEVKLNMNIFENWIDVMDYFGGNQQLLTPDCFKY